MTSARNLDRYRYVSDLGRGGMSHVVLAEDLLLNRRVALKRMNASEDSQAVLRLRREALIGASVSHPNLVSIYDIVAEEGGEYVIVMEYVDGQTLRDLLAGGRKLPASEALRILDGIAAGLDAIHAHGIVHRDIKPANILLATNGDVKLADLGIASAPDRTRITAEGVILGTLGYVAPEQLEGTSVTPATDIYALAVVAHEALSGRKAHSESNPVALAHAIVSRPPPDLRDAWPQAPAAAAELLIRALAADPAQRPKSATELMRGLRNAIEAPVTQPFATRAAVAPSAANARQTELGSGPRVTAAAEATGGAAASSSRAGSRPVHQLPHQPAARQQPRRPEQRPPRPVGERLSHEQGRRRGPVMAILFGALIVAAIAAILISQGTGGRTRVAASGARSRAGIARHKHPKPAAPVKPASGAASGSPTSGTPAASPAPTPTGTPTGDSPIAVAERFYELAAAHNYQQAWALADPTFRNQLGGYSSFAAGQALDRSITFDSAQVVSQTPDSATLAVRTTSVRANGTEHCAGTIQLQRAGQTWLVHLIGIQCT